MRYSVCIDAVFSQDPVAGIAKAAKYGAAVEFWKWWDRDLEAIKNALLENKAELCAFCTKFVSLTDPEKSGEYAEGLCESLETAKKLGCGTLISQVGQDTGKPHEEQLLNIVKGLERCVPYLEKAGVTLVIEPLNTKLNHPGYLLTKSSEAFDIIRSVGSGNVKVLFDIYHQQITEGDILRNLLPNIELVGHIHAAGSTGRNELYNGELDFGYIFSQLDKTAYKGFVGLEYSSSEDAGKGLEYAVKIAQNLK